jgi:integrase
MDELLFEHGCPEQEVANAEYCDLLDDVNVV